MNDIYLLVNRDNVGNFLIDFEKVLLQYVLVKEKLKSKGIDPKAIENFELVWIDDKKHDITYKIESDGK